MSFKRWIVVRCWQGSTSTLVPVPMPWSHWTRTGAEWRAYRMNSRATAGQWYEVRRVRERT